MIDVSDELHTAVNVGIADIVGGRFRSFDTPIVLDQYLQKLAAAVWSDENSTPSVLIPDEANPNCKLV